MIRDRSWGAHELIEALCRHHAITLGIGVHAVSITRRLAIDRDLEPDFVSRRRWPEYKMQVARVEAIDDAAVLLVELRPFFPDRPFA